MNATAKVTLCAAETDRRDAVYWVLSSNPTEGLSALPKTWTLDEMARGEDPREYEGELIPRKDIRCLVGRTIWRVELSDDGNVWLWLDGSPDAIQTDQACLFDAEGMHFDVSALP